MILDDINELMEHNEGLTKLPDPIEEIPMDVFKNRRPDITRFSICWDEVWERLRNNHERYMNDN